MQGQDGGALGAVEPRQGGLPQGGHGLVGVVLGISIQDGLDRGRGVGQVREDSGHVRPGIFEGRGLEDVGFDLLAGGQRRRGRRVDGEDDARQPRPLRLARQLEGGQRCLGNGVVLEDLNVLTAHASLGHTQDSDAHGRQQDGQVGQDGGNVDAHDHSVGIHCATIASNASEAAQRVPFSPSALARRAARPTPASSSTT